MCFRGDTQTALLAIRLSHIPTSSITFIARWS